MKLRNECLGRRSQALVRIRRWTYKLSSQERAGCPEPLEDEEVPTMTAVWAPPTARGGDARLPTLTSSLQR